MEKTRQTTIILFGAMGDLAWRKLLPSLLDLYNRKELPHNVHIMGASREGMNNATFKKYVQSKLPKAPVSFIELLSYTQIDLLEKKSYIHLEKALNEREQGKGGHRLFHLAVPPTLYKDIFINLGKSDIAKESDGWWRRILVEKPFGYDLATAKELNGLVKKYFTEQQIYRVDHYLAKEAVESLMAFRFSNVLFAHAWDNTHITSVHIRMYETMGVENRGSFYETVGALRDVGQNHLLQLLALIAMKRPDSLNAKDVSKARQAVLDDLHIYTQSEIQKNTRRAQYLAYRSIPDVAKNSQRETYFALQATINQKRWEGVPFIIEGGKAMPENRIDITIEFKREVPCLCKAGSPAHEHANTLTFTLKPENKTEIAFWVKEPGFDYTLEQHTMSFTHHKHEVNKAPDAYADILHNALLGEKLVFPSADEIEASWRFIDAILNGWRTQDTATLLRYRRGTVPKQKST